MALRGRARRIQAQHGLDLVVVDYLQLMAHPRAESVQMEISEISRSLKALARELNVPVIALSQLSRAVEGPHAARLADARLARVGSIEQDADVVMMLYRQVPANKEELEQTKSQDDRPAQDRCHPDRRRNQRSDGEVAASSRASRAS
jgi:replicative DNA helicase